MSTNAEALAARFTQANQAMIDLIASVPEDALRRTCDAEGWTAAAVAAHVAAAHGFLIGRVRCIARGEEFPPFDHVAFHEGNRQDAAANAHLSRDAVIDRLRERGERAVDALRRLSDDELARTKAIPAMGEEPVSAQTFAERVLIGHTNAHLESLRKGLGIATG